jgi:nicotinamide mononucleotide transporter
LTIINHVVDQFQATTALEWLAFFFAIAQVILAYKNNIFNFYIGIVSVSLYAFLFFQAGLFAESALNIYYFIASLVGIILWGKQGQEKPITFSGKKDWLYGAILFIISWAVLYFILARYTTSNVPFWDSLVSSLAWAGTWLLMKRKVENWLVLNISNVIAIPLFIYKGLELTALLTIIYLVLAIAGFISWKKMAVQPKLRDRI